jgi:DNA-binding NtrC family response regulator
MNCSLVGQHLLASERPDQPAPALAAHPAVLRPAFALIKEVSDVSTLEGATRRPVVLVVDDDADVRALAGAHLRHHGFDPLPADGGRQAVEVYRQRCGHIDVVLLDVVMPGLDGPQTLAALRQADPAVRAVFMSGYTNDYTEADLAGMGAASFVAKPFRSAELASALRRALDS